MPQPTLISKFENQSNWINFNSNVSNVQNYVGSLLST